jgi:hypothetical protein
MRAAGLDTAAVRRAISTAAESALKQLVDRLDAIERRLGAAGL